MAGVPTLVAEPAVRYYDLAVVDLGPLRASVRATGELDLAARDDLAAVFQEQLDAGRRIVRLDLSAVTFLDCSCLGVLIAAHQRFLDLRGLLVLSGVTENVARVLAITGTDDRLFIVPGSEEPEANVPLARARRLRVVPRQRDHPAPCPEPR